MLYDKHKYSYTLDKMITINGFRKTHNLDRACRLSILLLLLLDSYKWDKYANVRPARGPLSHSADLLIPAALNQTNDTINLKSFSPIANEIHDPTCASKNRAPHLHTQDDPNDLVRIYEIVKWSRTKKTLFKRKFCFSHELASALVVVYKLFINSSKTSFRVQL